MIEPNESFKNIGEELRGKVFGAIFDIMHSADLTVMTTAIVRATVFERFSINPSLPDLKMLVKSVVIHSLSPRKLKKKKKRILMVAITGKSILQKGVLLSIR